MVSQTQILEILIFNKQKQQEILAVFLLLFFATHILMFITHYNNTKILSLIILNYNIYYLANFFWCDKIKQVIVELCYFFNGNLQS